MIFEKVIASPPTDIFASDKAIPKAMIPTTSSSATTESKVLVNEKHPYNKTIFSVVKEEILEDLTTAIRNIFNEKKPGIGFMFTVPVGNIYLLDK
jgi:nitrogen regulatory protein PII